MLSDERIDELARPHITTVGSHWEHDDAIPDNGRIEDFARAIEAEVRKDYESLIRQMLEHLEVVTDAGPDGEGWQSQDLKNTIAAATARLEKAP